MTDKERKDTQKAMLYDLRLIIKSSERSQYTKEEPQQSAAIRIGRKGSVFHSLEIF